MKSKLIITGLMLESLLSSAADVTRDDINKQLKKIAKEPAPTKLSPGAMCYDIAVPPSRIEYYCPVCKTRTFYDRTFILNRITFIRRWPAALKKLGLECRIDESDFCPKCSKNKKFDARHPRALYWEITVGKRIIRNKLQLSDYNLLTAFMQKKLKVAISQGQEEALKKYLPRLRQLLGMPDAGSAKK